MEILDLRPIEDMSDIDTNINNDDGEPKAEPAKKRRQRRSPNWGGARPGSGRHPNEVPTLWMQVATVMTESDAAVVTELSPGQRANRLLNPAPSDLVLDSIDSAGTAPRRPYNFRIALNTLEERNYILQLNVAERTRRLLTLPVGGVDPQDERKGKWYGSGKNKE